MSPANALVKATNHHLRSSLDVINVKEIQDTLSLISLYTSFFANKINDLQPIFLDITGMATNAELVRLIQNPHFLPNF